MMKRTITTRSTIHENKISNVTKLKRKSNQSPNKVESNAKRLALGDITNAKSKANSVLNTNATLFKKPTTSKSVSNSTLTTVAVKTAATKVVQPTLATSKTTKTSTITNGVLSKAKIGANVNKLTNNIANNKNRVVLRKINPTELAKKKEIPSTSTTVANKPVIRQIALKPIQEKNVAARLPVSKSDSIKSKRLVSKFDKITIVDLDKPEETKVLSSDSQSEQSDDENKENQIERYKAIKRIVPDDVVDFDAETSRDIYQVSSYAYDIFEYLKSNETVVDDYITRQKDITTKMRRLLVDWMVEIQDNFELTHETLYLSVKMVDIYLSREIVTKDTLQLIGAVSLYIASKYEEKIPPLADDFVYVCDGSYSRSQLLDFEMKVFKCLDFFVGYPLSYRFLRRYARCGKLSMPILTLARYILETSLLEYSFVTISDSKLAAASLYIALKMNNIGTWTPTLEYFSGYKLKQIMPIALSLNSNIHKQFQIEPNFVKTKYSTELFYEVAKKKLLDNSEL